MCWLSKAYEWRVEEEWTHLPPLKPGLLLLFCQAAHSVSGQPRGHLSGPESHPTIIIVL